jgi:hypothetical protein
MAASVELVVGIEHGEGCTCQRLAPFEYTITPVVVDRACPGLKRPTPRDHVDGRLIITWPAASFGVVNGWGVTLHDADTGEQIVTVTRLAIVLGDDEGFGGGPVEAVLTALTDANGKLLPAGAPVVPDETGEGFRTAVFRYAVSEMRVAEPCPSNPADGGC